jgi:hypothetical protein
MGAGGCRAGDTADAFSEVRRSGALGGAMKVAEISRLVNIYRKNLFE